MNKIIHLRDDRLYINSGMDFPLCLAGARQLDLPKSLLPMTDMLPRVTCKRCLRTYECGNKGRVK